MVKCIDIELAIMDEFDFRHNLIVPNVSTEMQMVPFQTDMVVLTRSSYAYGFEIKVSKADLLKDLKKPQIARFNEQRNGKSGIDRFYSVFKYFCYAVPEHLREFALELIPQFCGLWVYSENPVQSKGYEFYQAKDPQKLSDYKWPESKRHDLARLGAMRIYAVKKRLSR